jgi:putative phosphoesterase
MKIAVLSDIHDNIWKLEDVLERINETEAGVLIFCGDFCAPFTLKQIADGFSGPVHCVFGNNDGDKWFLTRIASGAGHVTLHGELAELALNGRRVAVNHYPHIARGLAASGLYDAVFYGHSHERHLTQVGGTLLLNPGEVMGRLGPSTYALYDTQTGQATILEL